MKLILESADAPPAVLHGAEGDSACFLKKGGVGPAVQNARTPRPPAQPLTAAHENVLQP